MARQSPTAEFNTLRLLTFLAVFLLFALLVIASNATADTLREPNSANSSTTDSLPLKPYTAKYKTTARGMSITLKRELQLADDGVYTLSNSGSIMIVGFEEESRFRVDETRVTPISYTYQGKGLINRRREVQFTAGADTLQSLYKDKWYELPYTDNTLDRMSQQEQLRLLLLNDPTPNEDINIKVADGKRVKNYKLAFVGTETVQTALGDVKTLHFKRIHSKPDRKSDTWVAPAWGYIMVKTVHVEDGKPVVASIVSASIDGNELGSD